MLHPRRQASDAPEKVACICTSTGQTLTYGALEDSANQGAQLLRALGLATGGVMAVMLDNECAAFEIAWAAQRVGLYLTSISTRLSVADATYIVENSDAQILVVSDRMADIGREIAEACPGLQVFTVADDSGGMVSWRGAIASFPRTPVTDEVPGTDMLYSSGTTGRPKGVKPPLPTGPLGDETPLTRMGSHLYDMGESMVYLSTAPLYHAAPLRWAMTVQRFGGTVVMMRKFDPEVALGLIEKHKVTHGTWVPTHFVRLLKLPDAVRASYDLSSMRAAIHASAPCPVPVKQAMIDWWGPILEEYYAGTETCGITALSSSQWLDHPGSVGRPVLGKLHILDDDGHPLPVGATGNIWFSEGPRFEYHKDPEKTAASHNALGWATLGDIGLVDADNFLYLKGRKHFMIISGGVNIYPQEIENLLVTHPMVADAAVLGVPDEDLGEIALAVVQLLPEIEASDETSRALFDFLRRGLGSIKTPKRIEFRKELPREPTGKLLKGKLQEELCAGRSVFQAHR